MAAAEQEGRFPRAEFATLGRAGLLSLPYGEDIGGGGQSYETYLQVVEELATAWLAVGLGVSVHTLTCYPIATAGTRGAARALAARHARRRTSSAPTACPSPAAARTPRPWRTRAVADGDEFVIDGVKAWTTHGGAG